jgi:hypothetical protein
MKPPVISALVALFICAGAQSQTVPGDQAQKNGVRACQHTVEEMAKFIVKDNKHASLAVWNNKAPDSRLFNSQIVVNYTDGQSLAILNVAPTRTNKCDSTYSTIFTSEKSCVIMRETSLKEWKFSGELGGLVVLENKDGSLSKILLPAGSGCVAVTTEVAYD